MLKHRINSVQISAIVPLRPLCKPEENSDDLIKNEEKMQEELELPKLDMKSQSTFNLDADQDICCDKEYELKCIDIFSEQEEESM